MLCFGTDLWAKWFFWNKRVYGCWISRMCAVKGEQMPCMLFQITFVVPDCLVHSFCEKYVDLGLEKIWVGHCDMLD